MTDSLGLTLYRFRPGHRRAARLKLRDDCAKTGRRCPPTTPRPARGSTSRCSGRSPGRRQPSSSTVAGWPAYRYVKDVNAGDVKARALGGKWYALNPEGKKVAGGRPARAVHHP
ncbi:hypothetical protein GCM10023238_00250 [Streptomyces heliomycini]